MPRRLVTYKPSWLRERRRQRDRESRPNSAARGYGSAAWQKLRRQVIVRDGAVCQACGIICEAYAQVDHIVPKAQGGTDDLGNLQTLCRRCHSKKTAQESR